jgi:hypothetical protein
MSSAEGNTSVLLLGEAQAPGSLVLTATDSAAFGDVPIGTTTTHSFVLQNPAQLPSGRLTISSDYNPFEIDLGDCNQAGPEGLVTGASCTFDLRFTPSDNPPQVASLAIQSPGAGRAGLQISGRGRQPASLSATGNRDLGRANVGQDALTPPQNEFTWTVNNQGDLPTGTLTLQNDNSAEFTIRDDSCSGCAVPERASCQMVIRFRPSAAGNRSARVVASDPDGGAGLAPPESDSFIAAMSDSSGSFVTRLRPGVRGWVRLDGPRSRRRSAASPRTMPSATGSSRPRASIQRRVIRRRGSCLNPAGEASSPARATASRGQPFPSAHPSCQ